MSDNTESSSETKPEEPKAVVTVESYGTQVIKNSENPPKQKSYGTQVRYDSED